MLVYAGLMFLINSLPYEFVSVIFSQASGVMVNNPQSFLRWRSGAPAIHNPLRLSTVVLVQMLR